MLIQTFYYSSMLLCLTLSLEGFARSESKALSQARIRVVASTPSLIHYGQTKGEKNKLSMDLPDNYDVNLLKSGDSKDESSKVFGRVTFDKQVKRIELIF